VTVRMQIYNTRKKYTVIESLDLMRNISWLASCFSKIKKPIKKCSVKQNVIAIKLHPICLLAVWPVLVSYRHLPVGIFGMVCTVFFVL
jgi:hypothetical protein